jgi:hypothetical protein
MDTLFEKILGSAQILGLLNAPQPNELPTNNEIPTNDEIRTNILAFRTITKLLSLIQQEQSFQDPQVDPEVVPLVPLEVQRQQLKIMNALSTVAVMDNEVIAAVNNSGLGTFDLDSNTLKLIACVECSPDQNPQTASSKSLSSKIWDVICSRNYRFDDPKPSPTNQPTITDTKVFAVNLADDDAIEQHVEEYW